MKNQTPELLKESFKCPHADCGLVSKMSWFIVSPNFGNNFKVAKCDACDQVSVWVPSSNASNTSGAKMIYPDVGFAEPPHPDMPENIAKDYSEASSVYNKSPKAAAALLRLGLQKLLKHLGQGGENINNDIRALAKENVLPAQITKAADTMRLTGNNAVHPGEMNDEDVDFIASKMFGLLNFIVQKAITDPKELEEMYQMTPERKRKAAEEQDAKNRQSNQ